MVRSIGSGFADLVADLDLREPPELRHLACIEAGIASDAAGRGKIRLVVSDPGRAKTALGAAKIRCSEEPALMLSMDDRPGALAGVAARLAAARINIKCTYATTGGGSTAQVVLVVANPDKAERALA